MGALEDGRGTANANGDDNESLVRSGEGSVAMVVLGDHINSSVEARGGEKNCVKAAPESTTCSTGSDEPGTFLVGSAWDSARESEGVG